MESKFLNKSHYDRLKAILQLTFSTIEHKIELFNSTYSKEDLDLLIDSSFYYEFDKFLSIYRTFIGSERFIKLLENHNKQHADP